MYISGIIFFFRMHFMCIFIYVGLLYCSVFISYTILYAPFSFFHITSNTVYIKHSGRNFISVCQVIYLFFCWNARLCTFVGAFYVFDVWKPWYLSNRCHIIIILDIMKYWTWDQCTILSIRVQYCKNIKSPMNY